MSVATQAIQALIDSDAAWGYDGSYDYCSGKEQGYDEALEAVQAAENAAREEKAEQAKHFQALAAERSKVNYNDV